MPDTRDRSHSAYLHFYYFAVGCRRVYPAARLKREDGEWRRHWRAIRLARRRRRGGHSRRASGASSCGGVEDWQNERSRKRTRRCRRLKKTSRTCWRKPRCDAKRVGRRAMADADRDRRCGARVIERDVGHSGMDTFPASRLCLRPHATAISFGLSVLRVLRH